MPAKKYVLFSLLALPLLGLALAILYSQAKNREEGKTVYNTVPVGSAISFLEERGDLSFFKECLASDSKSGDSVLATLKLGEGDYRTGTIGVSCGNKSFGLGISSETVFILQSGLINSVSEISDENYRKVSKEEFFNRAKSGDLVQAGIYTGNNTYVASSFFKVDL
ncbi:MAG: hypothetical protein ABH814_01335 [bacterium]